MLKIRLKRVGKKRDSAFRVIVSDSSKSISSGKYVDQIGFYDPRNDKKNIDTEKASQWLSNGAQPTDTVYNLLIDAGVIEGRKKNVLPRKSAPVVEAEESEDSAEETTEAESPAAESTEDTSESSDDSVADADESKAESDAEDDK
tara:strand:+ start:149 stop:583 length:435 start_codon:yes stop_codon:yes gene_type:complete